MRSKHICFDYSHYVEKMLIFECISISISLIQLPPTVSQHGYAPKCIDCIETGVINLCRRGNPMEQKLRVMVVEDDEMNTFVLVTMLKNIGVREIISVSNGAKAVDAFDKADGLIHVIFMDLNMPVMDGTAAAMIIRDMEADMQNRGFRTIIYAVSAYDIFGTCESPCFDSFILKPVSRNLLLGLFKHFRLVLETQKKDDHAE